MCVSLLQNPHGSVHLYVYLQLHTLSHGAAEFFTLISWESFCIDCCIPPNCPYILSLTFSKESLTCKETRRSRRALERRTSHRLIDPAKARLFAAFVSAHLSDVPHLILKVTDRPLTGHHLPLSLRAGLLHSAGHFGLRVLQRCLWDPIGHVCVGLRGARIHSSGFSGRPG